MISIDFTDLSSSEQVRSYRKKSKVPKGTKFEIIGQRFANHYEGIIKNEILIAIKLLMNSSEKNYVTLDLDPKRFLESEGSHIFDFHRIRFHVVHYGGKISEGKWKNRIPNKFFAGLFKSIQKSLFERGYYLLDISDPSKSHKFIVRLYLEKPSWYDDAPMLWHGLNKI